MPTSPRISIIGAGPGGLTAAMLLAASGADVTVWEAEDRPGGRSRRISFDGHHFDCGATFFMMPWVLEEITRACGYRLSDLIPMTRLDPMYRLVFRGELGDLQLDTTQDIDQMAARLDRIHPGDGAAFRRFMQENRAKLEAMTPVLRQAVKGPMDLVSAAGLKAAPETWASLSMRDNSLIAAREASADLPSCAAGSSTLGKQTNQTDKSSSSKRRALEITISVHQQSRIVTLS